MAPSQRQHWSSLHVSNPVSAVVKAQEYYQLCFQSLKIKNFLFVSMKGFSGCYNFSVTKTNKQESNTQKAISHSKARNSL